MKQNCWKCEIQRLFLDTDLFFKKNPNIPIMGISTTCNQWFQFLTYEELYYYLLLLRNIIFDLGLQAIKLIATTYIAKSPMILLAEFIERGKMCVWIAYRNVDSCIHSDWLIEYISSNCCWCLTTTYIYTFTSAKQLISLLSLLRWVTIICRRMLLLSKW